MALISTALHCAAVPFLLLFTVPMMLFAVFTGAIAFVFLGVRFALIWVQLAIALLKYWIFRPRPTEIPESTRQNFSNTHAGWRTPTTPPETAISASGSGTRILPARTTLANPGFSSPYRRRSSLLAESARRASQLDSQTSLGTGSTNTALLDPSLIINGDGIMSPSVGMLRDYEGIGGWRRDDGDESWLNINSRLELPSHTQQRSHSLGPLAPNDGAWFAMARTHPTPMEKRATQAARAQAAQANSSRVRAQGPPRTTTFVTAPDSYVYLDSMVSPRTVREPGQGSGGRGNDV